MDCLRIKDDAHLAAAVETSSKVFIDRILYSWQEDLWLRRKWNFTGEETKNLHMKEICFMIDDEQIELLHPIMEEEPKCKVTFGQGNLETLSLVLKFKLTDMKVTGTMRSYSSSKPCKSFPYELLLKDVECLIMAGLIIRGDSFCIENYSNEYLNYNVALSYKNKDESKEIFPLDKVQDLNHRKSIEKYIVDKLTKDIIIAVEDRIGEECVDTSVSSMLNNEYSYRNKLRLHKKKMTIAFQNLAIQIVEMVNNQINNKRLSEVSLPDLGGKLLEKDNERGCFKATEGSLKKLSSLQQLGDIAVYKDGEAIIIFIFLYFSYLDIVYKHLGINKKNSEEIRSFETPENSNSSYMKLKIEKIKGNNISKSNDDIKLTLINFKVEDLGYIEINWDAPENDSLKKFIEPEFAMWLNYILEYKVSSILEERIKHCLEEVLKEEKLVSLVLHPENIDEVYDSDPLDNGEENAEIEEEIEQFKECLEDNSNDNSN